MQGFNMGRYYPPDTENAPTFNTSHPLGARARKINQGILTVRFEMPFAIWCDTCKPAAIIGQGVRFNAEKKKVGNYYSTPIWSFRMKHTACGGWIEIRTDPKNTEYTVHEGGRRRDYGEDKLGDGELLGLTEAERESRRTDAFAAFEGKKEEKGLEMKHRERVEELLEAQERDWEDPYTANQRLRRSFRVTRKARRMEEEEKAGMQERFGLGFDIVDEAEGDRARAALADFGPTEIGDARVEAAERRPLFAPVKAKETPSEEHNPTQKKLKAQIKAERSRDELQHQLLGNTRAVVDPFLNNGRTAAKVHGLIPGLKRKREEKGVTARAIKGATDEGSASHIEEQKRILLPLLDYDSD